jgi:hypothetical protein
MSAGVIADEQVATAAFDALDAALDTVLNLDGAMLGNRARLARLARYKQVRRRLSAGEHPLINQPRRRRPTRARSRRPR